jgi:hypothetical protein
VIRHSETDISCAKTQQATSSIAANSRSEPRSAALMDVRLSGILQVTYISGTIARNAIEKTDFMPKQSKYTFSTSPRKVLYEVEEQKKGRVAIHVGAALPIRVISKSRVRC